MTRIMMAAIGLTACLWLYASENGVAAKKFVARRAAEWPEPFDVPKPVSGGSSCRITSAVASCRMLRRAWRRRQAISHDEVADRHVERAQQHAQRRPAIAVLAGEDFARVRLLPVLDDLHLRLEGVRGLHELHGRTRVHAELVPDLNFALRVRHQWWSSWS